VKELSTKH